MWYFCGFQVSRLSKLDLEDGFHSNLQRSLRECGHFRARSLILYIHDLGRQHVTMFMSGRIVAAQPFDSKGVSRSMKSRAGG